MMHNLSPIQSRLLALLILALALGLIYSLTVMPLVAMNAQYADRIDNLERRLRILDNKVASGDELRARQQNLRKLFESNEHYLTSNTEALAGADLQNIVKRLSRLSSCEILSTQPLASTQESGFRAVSLKVRMRGKLDNLVRVFHGLETGKPYLFIDNLSIRSRIQHSRKIDFKAGNNARVIDLVETLDVEFELTGYLRKTS
jgi:general secretion pathway protein M